MPKREKRVPGQRPSADATRLTPQSASETVAPEASGANRSMLFLALACYVGWLLFLLLVAWGVIR